MKVVLQVLADPWRGNHHGNMVSRQDRRITDARELQNLWRADGTRAQHDLPGHANHMTFIVALDLRAATHGVAAGTLLEQEPRDLSLGPDGEISTRLLDRIQKRLRCIPPPSAALVDFEISDPSVVATVEVLDCRDSRLRCGKRECVKNVPAQTLLLNSPLAAVAVQRLMPLMLELPPKVFPRG